MKRFSLSFCWVFFLALILSACGATPDATEVSNDRPNTPQSHQTSLVSEALFQVIKPDGTTQDFKWDNLKKLPLARITVEGKTEEGPKLLDVLHAAGITDFEEVTLTGSTSPVTLTRDQVDDNTILDFTNRGTVKLATAYLPKADWTKDISKIVVKE